MISPSFHGPNQVLIDESGGNHFVRGKAMEIEIIYVKKLSKETLIPPKPQTFNTYEENSFCSRKRYDN